MFFIFKIKHFKLVPFLLLLLILSSCQLKEPIKGHGINFLENRSKKILVNKSNKNDVIKVLGQAHTKSIDDNNLWFYFDRKITTGSMISFKNNKLLENNVLVIKFNKLGIVDNKSLLKKEDMKEVIYTDMKTNNPVSRESFVTKFLQSVKQKMYGKRKF
jgi:outer membrane protein assembly factor BamE (lipoprotein component of BamABCDE complex)